MASETPKIEDLSIKEFDPNPAEKKNPFYDFLHSISMKDAGLKKEVFTLHGENSVDEAVLLLSEKQILSAPVTETKNSKKIIGSLDVVDVLKYVHKVAPTFEDLQDDALSSLTVAGRAIALVEVGKLLKDNETSVLLPLELEAPLSEAVQLFATGIHRAMLTHGDSEEPIGMCSQSDIVRLLSKYVNRGKLKAMGELPCKSFGLGEVTPVVVKSDRSVLYVLQRMIKENVSCVAITDPESGRLVGNFSASDLRGLYFNKFPGFRLAVGSFLAKKHEDSLTPVVVNHDTSLGELVATLSDNKLHHVWVVDGDFKPDGIVSLTDVMKAVRDHAAYV